MHRLLIVALLLSSWSVRAEDPPFSDLHGREPVVRDLAPRIVPLRSGDDATLSVSFGTRSGDAGRDYRGGVILSVPTDRFLGVSKAKRPALEEGDRDDDLETKGRGDAPPASPGEPGAVPPPEPSSILPRFRPRDARAAISAAHDRFDLSSTHRQLDALQSRARWSGLMPRLRLRVTRTTDESVSLSPTSYDDSRMTSRGGAKLWLEARGTFQLDRLVFASEELRVERMRRRVDKQSAELADRVLEQLFAWQRHLHHLYDPFLDPEACLRHALALEEASLQLDVLTDGWFADWRADNELPAGSCMDPAPAEGRGG